MLTHIISLFSYLEETNGGRNDSDEWGKETLKDILEDYPIIQLRYDWCFDLFNFTTTELSLP